jgi:hypothetical protein
MADNSMVSASCLPNTIYDLPAFDLPFKLALPAPTIKFNLDDLLHASSSTNVLKVLGNSGDEVIATGFNDFKSSKPSPLTSPALETE